ncbi:RHS repeat domain-containing protein [Microbacterium sp. Leaf161]|uniref:RHS repeat domain-containing protein n=1 Tax=Microbacterium sp. Leaf161 TaxID=1736281 RepID=UPI000B17CF5E|nr:RHS repeat-associated core domain-containing protein [Microbacterium sp. Leaf161]
MTYSLGRRVLGVAVAAVLVCGVLVAAPGAAIADATPTVPTPVFGDPVPGAVLGDVETGEDAASSTTAATPSAQELPQLKVTEVSLAPSDSVGVTTEGEEDSTAATVIGEWTPLADTGIALAPAGVRPDKKPDEKKSDEEKSDEEKPDEQKPDAEKPDAENPDEEKPDEEKPDEEKPDEEKPDEEKPDAAEDEVEPPTALAVEVLDEKATTEKGLDGLVLSLTRADAPETGNSVAVRLPNELLSAAYGADFDSRLEWVQVPADTKASDLRKESVSVATASTDEGLVLTPAVSAEPMLLAALAGASSSSGTGSYAATPLKSSSTWDVAEQTGAFTWNYEMGAPTAGAGPVPSVGLSYNSQSVDGLTASTNNQPSAVGEGWELTGAGFIERSYIPCAKDDGASGAVATSGDLCWRTDNATVSMAGRSGALIKDAASGVWRLQNDDGTRFERLVGTAQGCAPNGTVNNECWRMTTTDGTRYFFGLNQLPGWSSGKPTTNSTWTVPVFGNDAGEPCHASTFATSSCNQAWRWNLDYVVDVHGNAQTMYYTAETNKYAKGGSGATAYHRGGALTRIEYGFRSTEIFAANAAGYRVLFTYDAKGRCNDASGATCTTGTLDGAVAPANPAKYPDVPWDQLCTGTSCSASQIVPTFFTNASLAKVTSQAKVSGAYSTVDSWVLSHSFPDPGDNTSAALWLTKVQRTGTAAGQAAIAEPPTLFSGATMQNRVWVVDGLAPLDKWRLTSIKTSLGAAISVNYRPQQCTAAQAPAILADLANNTRWCFPEWWVPQSTIPLGGRQDLFHKYPVSSILVNGATGGPLSQVQQTQYFYGTPKWRYNDSPLTVANARTWNVFAGVDAVEVREGNPATPAAQKVSKYTYYQGMNGDRATATGGTKAVNVTGTSIPDDRWFAGQTYRQQTFNGVGGALVTDQISTPWASGISANDGTRQARKTGVQKTIVTEPLSTGGNRTLETRTTFDSTYGYPLTVSTIPSDATGKCVTTTYAAPNTSAWIIGLPSQERAVNTTCADLAAAQFPRDLVSDVKTTYDGLAWGAAPSKGLATSSQVVDKYENGQPHWVNAGSSTYDALGRALTKTDALGRKTSTAYTPAAAQPLLSTTETNTAPFSWQTVTSFEPTTGATSKVVDPNGSTTTIAIDGLGRTTNVWLPLRPQATNPSSPSMAFSYTLSQTAPNAIKTSTVTGGGVVDKFELFDGLGRATQTQTLAVGGGTVVKTTNYDHQGRVYFVDNDYWTASISPGTAFFTPVTEDNVPSQVVTAYDAVGRPLTSTLNTTGSLRSKTVNAYAGADRVDTTPPIGGTATSTFTNTLGHKTKLVQYLTGAISGTGQSTTFAYDGGNRMTKMTDPAGNAWTWTFDLLGNRVGQDDADSGVSTATYDLVGNMTSTTDARGKTVTTTYDELNRKKATYAGTASGSMLSSWTYDSVKKGLVTTSTSYTGSAPGTPGLAYATTVGAYDAAGNPLDTTLSIPAGAPAFAGTSYKTTLYYNPDSSLQAKQMPAMGGLPSELIRYSYDTWGKLSGVRGTSIILANTVYSPIGQLSQLNRMNGSTSTAYSTYAYDQATGAVMAIDDLAVFGGTGHSVASRAYTRDAVGNVTSATMNSVLPTNGTQKTCYTYDGLRQLTRAWTPNAATACTAAPSAGAMGGLEPYWHDYTYDTKTGNRTSLVKRSTMGAVSTAAYTYPAAGGDRPHSVNTVTGPAGTGPGSYTYDAAGNMTGRPGQTITFNDVGKVSKVVTGSVTQDNVYNVDGSLLLRKSSKEGASLFVGDTVLSQAPGSSVVSGVRTYSGAEGKPIAEKSAKTGTTGTTLTWLFSNLEGTVDVQTVASAVGTTTRMLRDPYGAPIGGSSGVWSSGTGYMNKPVTASTGLTTVGARTYDPVLGKFLSVDPVIDTNLPQQNTGYTYSGNNPTTYMDPTGLRLSIGCEPNCPKGSATIAQKLTPRSPVSNRPSSSVQPSSREMVNGMQRSGRWMPSPSTTPQAPTAYPAGVWTGSEQRIARDWGRSVQDVKSAIHELKDELKYPGARKNPDVEVNIETGEVRIKGGDGEPVGNLDDYFEESHWAPPQQGPTIDIGAATAGVMIGLLAVVGFIASAPAAAVTG